MTKEEFGNVNREANENIAFQYFQEFMSMHASPEWVSTHTDGEYDRWDVTATNGKKVVYAETKIRHIHVDAIKDEGAIVDESKVLDLKNMDGDAIIVFFFHRDNATYAWNVTESDEWAIGTKTTRKNNYTDEKVDKKVCYMPIDKKHRRKGPDLSDYQERYAAEFQRIKENKGYE